MKKALSLALVLVMVLGMAAVAFASAPVLKIEKNDANRDTVQIKSNNNDVDDEFNVVLPRDGEAKYSTAPINFKNTAAYDAAVADGIITATATGGITKEEVDNSKIDVKVQKVKGGVALKEAKIDYDANGFAYIKVIFNDKFVSNNKDGVNYEFKVYVTVNGTQWSKSMFTLKGNYKNDLRVVDVDDGSAYLGDGYINEANKYTKEIEMDLGEGVSLFGKMFKEKRYWGIANKNVSNDDELLFDQYDLVDVYHIDQAGLEQVASYVKLDEDSDLFVYDKDFNLLGKGNAKLPYSDTYYLAAKELEIDTDEPVDEDGSDVPELSGETGGDDFYPANVNDNPGTGC